MNNIFLFRLSLMAIIVLFAGFLACNDKGTEPNPLPPTDYPVYFGDGESTHKLFTYYPLTNRLDSTVLVYQPLEGVTVSADGKLLYLYHNNKITIIERESLNFIADLPYAAKDPVAVSPDNSLIAIMGDNLYILKTEDYSVVFSDTDATRNGTFSADSRTLYCTGKTGPGGYAYLYRVLLIDTTPQVKRLEFDDGSVNYAIPTPDERKVILYSRHATYVGSFRVYDQIGDSVIFEEFMTPGVGRIAMTPDGRYAFYGNPGSNLPGPFAPSLLTVFDIESNKISQTINTKGFVNDSIPRSFPVRDMAVTPDGRWLVAINGPTPNQLLLFDIVKMQLLDYHILGFNKYLTNPSIQNSR